MKALIVDDDYTSRRLLQRYLSPYGQCYLAGDGTEALDLFKQALDQGEPYDMICLDIMMNDMGGSEALKQIRKIEENKNIKGLDGVKVIMVSALDDSKNVMNAFNTGCEAYIVKPVDKDKLIRTMKELLVP